MNTYIYSLSPALCLEGHFQPHSTCLQDSVELSLPPTALPPPTLLPPGSRSLPLSFHSISACLRRSIFHLFCCLLPFLSPPPDHESPCPFLQQNVLSHCHVPVTILGSGFTKAKRHSPCPQGTYAPVGDWRTHASTPRGGEILPGRRVRGHGLFGGPHKFLVLLEDQVQEGRLGKVLVLRDEVRQRPHHEGMVHV